MKPASLPLQVLAGLALSCAVWGQTTQRTPAELIWDLTYQSDRPDLHGTRHGVMGTFSCGWTAAEDEDNQALTDALVKYGGAAIPALEKALQSVQDHDDSPYSLNAKWLMEAYARILGPDAHRRLDQMAGLPRLRYFAQALDHSMALAFGLTSYVSSWRRMSCSCEGRFSVDCNACSPEQQRPFSLYLVCSTHPPDPRIRPLDELILTWERGNRVLLEANLGPRAKASLEQLLAGKTWAQLRSILRRAVRLWFNSDVGSAANAGRCASISS
jgi:hypothetical protein